MGIPSFRVGAASAGDGLADSADYVRAVLLRFFADILRQCGSFLLRCALFGRSGRLCALFCGCKVRFCFLHALRLQLVRLLCGVLPNGGAARSGRVQNAGGFLLRIAAAVGFELGSLREAAILTV